MGITSWSRQRILLLWAIGLVIQAGMLLTPTLLARRLVANSSDLLREAAEQDARWRLGEVADSLSLAKQRAEARAARTYSITASGDTLFPLVSAPSGRPDPLAVAAVGRKAEHQAHYALAVILGLIPALLILVTVIWLAVRRDEVEPPQSLGAA